MNAGDPGQYREPGQHSARDAILDAARTLFAERGYRAVTVRDIAAAASCSPALVIKHFGSKEGLFAQTKPEDPLTHELRVPRAELGEALVFRVLMRGERGLPEPWLAITRNVREAPDAAAAREEASADVLRWSAELIGDTTPGRRHAAVVCALMFGLAEAVRTMDLLAPRWAFDDVVRHYGRKVQEEIDACG